ncbi:amidase [Peptoniphilus olsenii]|uniref:Amidase n=1 Tax=Peptoniphilus olsenii TaxID=411570 RepID=A0ABV2JC25_9FIRM
MKVLDNLNYVFSKDNEPICKVKSGEIITFKTVDCFAEQVKDETYTMDILDLNKANPTSGPAFIEGAVPGDVIAVDILDIKIENKGFACSIPEVGPLANISEMRTRIFEIENDYVSFHNIKWKVNPMIGVIGLAPEDGDIACGLAGKHGGNLDSKKIVKGARVYLPVKHVGGLLQMGDLHASMGDGEISGTGIEVSGEVVVRVNLIKDFELNWPIIETKDNWYVNGVGKDFSEAYLEATKELARLMKATYPLDTTDIFIYLSLQGDIEINQYVHPVEGEMPSVRFGIPKTEYAKPLINFN